MMCISGPHGWEHVHGSGHVHGWGHVHGVQCRSLGEAAGRGVAAALQHHGKEMSYNNYLDADAAYSAVCDYAGATSCCFARGAAGMLPPPTCGTARLAAAHVTGRTPAPPPSP